MPHARDNPIAAGSALALAAALLFGATAPLVKHFGLGVGPFATAALLYAGALMGAGLPRRRGTEAAVRRAHAGRLVLVALVGAAIAPACLVWGLQRAGALAASLLLNLEAVLTIALARAFYREPIGGRVMFASTLMLAGGALLAVRSATISRGNLLGILAVAAAALGWAIDNTLTRPLSDLDPRAVVFWKALLGATLSVLLAIAAGDRWPAALALVALLVCGAGGYGVGLRLYLRAQRILGAGRTGSLFAFGPFVGAAIAFALGDRLSPVAVLGAGTLFGVAVWLHATERHGHGHRHESLVHEHAHRHDDGHHGHAHEPPVSGLHSHVHRHEATEHEHPHGADVHHRHEHR